MNLGACKWLSRQVCCQQGGFEAIFGAKGVALRQYLVPFWCIGGVGGVGVLVHWCIGVFLYLCIGVLLYSCTGVLV